MGRRQEINKIYGSPIYTIKPVIPANSTYVNDFDEYKADLPFNLISITNNSNSYLDVYIDDRYNRIFANETVVIDNRNFSNIKIITNTEAINDGDIVIRVQQEGIDANKKAREDYIKENNPINRILEFVGRLI